MILPQNRRGKHWIDPALQGRVVGLVLLTSTLLIAAHFVIERVLWRRLENVIADPLLLSRIQAELRLFDTVGLIVSAAATVAIALLAIRVSHRLVGPLLKLKNHLGRVANGEGPEPLSFRDDDLLAELPDLVNRAVDRRTGVRPVVEKAS